MNLEDLTNAEIKTLQEKYRQKEAGKYLYSVIINYKRDGGFDNKNTMDWDGINSVVIERLL